MVATVERIAAKPRPQFVSIIKGFTHRVGRGALVVHRHHPFLHCIHYRQCLFCTCSSCFIGRSPIVSEVCLKGVQKFYPFYCLYSQFRMRTSQNLRRTWANPIESYYVTEKPLFYCLYMVVEEWLFCFQEILKLSRHQPKRPLLCYGYHRYIYKSWAYNIVFI